MKVLLITIKLEEGTNITRVEVNNLDREDANEIEDKLTSHLEQLVVNALSELNPIEMKKINRETENG